MKTGKPLVRSGKLYVSDDHPKEIEQANTVGQAVWLARELIQTPSNIKTTAWFAAQAKKLDKKTNLSVKVLAGKDLSLFGGLLAVGGSSPNPGPRMVEISYAPRGSQSWPHVVLVGKGITFDTGGISLKRPYDAMIGMKSDMAGAAAVLATLSALPDIKPKVRVTALLMCAENSLSATAQRPGDVITQYGGTTVEIINTDAEGRLVLADGLAYANAKLNPDYLVDIATLTGAASLGLGRQYAAMYTRNQALSKKLQALGDSSGDRVWPMPLLDDYGIALKSDVADLNHTADAAKFSAGSVTAALFLEHFVGKRNWVHLDIAGPARSESDTGEYAKGGTGFGVRLLIDWIAGLS
jgi:leucyl aminopeptidase